MSRSLLIRALSRATLTLLFASVARAQEVAAQINSVTTFAKTIRWEGVAASVLAIATAFVVLRATDRIIENLGGVFVERRLLFQKLATFFRFTVYLVTIVSIVMLSFQISREILALIGGTAAVAIGFAMKDLAASIVSGVMIMFDRPFQLGDRVSFAGEYGDVVTVGLRSVKLRTLDDSIVTIPNNRFMTDVISCGNYGVLDMQIMVDFHIGVDQDVVRAREIVREAAVISAFVHLPKPVAVNVSQVVIDGLVAMQLRLKAYVLDTQYEKTFVTDVTLRVHEAFTAEGIQPPAILHRQIQPGAAIAETAEQAAPVSAQT
jgi:small-conductance mechanosensitive channel